MSVWCVTSGRLLCQFGAFSQVALSQFGALSQGTLSVWCVKSGYSVSLVRQVWVLCFSLCVKSGCLVSVW